MFSLYLKTHNQTGLNYLGVTRQNPRTYKGSGIYWRSHLKVHGEDVKTIVLLETESQELLNKTSIHFSKLWDIVKSDNFANLAEETGFQTNRTGRTSKRRSPSPEAIARRNASIAAAHARKTPEEKQLLAKKLSISNLGVKRSEETKSKVKAARAKQTFSTETRLKKSDSMKKVWAKKKMEVSSV